MVPWLGPERGVWGGDGKSIFFSSSDSAAETPEPFWTQSQPPPRGNAPLERFRFRDIAHATRSSNAAQCPSPSLSSDPLGGWMTCSGQQGPLRGPRHAISEVRPRAPHRLPPRSSPTKPSANTRKKSHERAARTIVAGVQVCTRENGLAPRSVAADRCYSVL